MLRGIFLIFFHGVFFLSRQLMYGRVQGVGYSVDNHGMSFIRAGGVVVDLKELEFPRSTEEMSRSSLVPSPRVGDNLFPRDALSG